MATVDELDRGREAYRRRAWSQAYTSLRLADEAAPLAADDLELLATASYLTARLEDGVQTLERAHHLRLDAGEPVRAAWCAIWTGFGLVQLAELAQAGGWFGRARRLLDREQHECVERGYLLVPAVQQQLGSGQFEAAHDTARAAVEAGERFGDVDLTAFALHAQGRALVKQGKVPDGLTLLDEAMVAVVAGELSSPVFTGLIYCSVIDACREVYEWRRGREWTGALAQWCDAQPELVRFTGQCLVHRSEVLQLTGAWPEAIEEARRAGERFAQGPPHPAAPGAFYQQGEVHRLLGDFGAAEDAYRTASRYGGEPYPGLALLWLAQGRPDAAVAAISRSLDAITDPLERAQLLPAHVEIMLATGDLVAARTAGAELVGIAEGFQGGALVAIAAHAQAAVDLADGDARAALIALRRALPVWQQVEAPYEIARLRVLVGLACRALGDDDGAGWEFEAARAGFEQLGAAPDLARLDSLTSCAPADRPHGLTPQELRVLRLVSTGGTNKAIAAELVVSERTVDRHVSNILTKLGVPSRAAATAYAYSHHLV
ncbi:MAG: helix-turn-helix transcriptional regulator [Pseudonocardiaceae bacterium]|nr:helix-turn-helix transcriptional regulator [Pseudonocardiaceae bacterium]